VKPFWQLFIDPGYSRSGRGCALAMFYWDALEAVWFERFSEQSPAKRCNVKLSVVQWEQPQADGRNADGDVLIRLASEGASLAAAYAVVCGGRVESVTPHAWKGSKPKPVQHAAVWRALTNQERECFAQPENVAGAISKAVSKGALERWKRPGAAYYPRSFPEHNLLDAVAMGLVQLGRI
jgi:hypothetical protein